MLFKDNPYLKNARGLGTAGQPDLIVEIKKPSRERILGNRKKFIFVGEK